MEDDGERIATQSQRGGGGGDYRRYDSPFYVNAKNALGLEQQATRSELLALALSKPANYFKLRADVVKRITEQSVSDIYNTYWDILKFGTYNEGTEQLTYIDATGVSKNFHPNLPEAEINKFALKVAGAIKDIAEEAVDEILPLRYNDLAVHTSKGLLKAKGVDV